MVYPAIDYQTARFIVTAIDVNDMTKPWTRNVKIRRNSDQDQCDIGSVERLRQHQLESSGGDQTKGKNKHQMGWSSHELDPNLFSTQHQGLSEGLRRGYYKATRKMTTTGEQKSEKYIRQKDSNGDEAYDANPSSISIFWCVSLYNNLILEIRVILVPILYHCFITEIQTFWSINIENTSIKNKESLLLYLGRKERFTIDGNKEIENKISNI
uniref:Uncharacterized protein n=1 Tax=Romanomermis culicivorax TaxID=13658 RepID=A0A915JZ53_ROMCU